MDRRRKHMCSWSDYFKSTPHKIREPRMYTYIYIYVCVAGCLGLRVLELRALKLRYLGMAGWTEVL